MRIATFLAVAAIAAAASIGPALAYGPATTAPSHSYLTGGQAAASVKAASQETQIAYFLIRKTNGYYVIVHNDNGRVADCEKRNCNTSATIGNFKGLIQINCNPDVDYPKHAVCVEVGKPSSE